MSQQEIETLAKAIERLSEEKRHALESLVSQFDSQPWRPLPGPQTMAYESKAQVIGFGGAAGGGKTDLAVGKALTQHSKVAIFRREAPQLTGIIDRFAQILETRDGFNGSDRIWRGAGSRDVQIEFCSCPLPGDVAKYQGRPKDLLVLDEASNFLESQVRFLMGWVRTTETGLTAQTLMTFNPPTTAEGRWVIAYFAPWLEKNHPNPAQPGELRWFTTIDGKDVEVPDGKPFKHKGETLTPQSRTFIPSRITDNPYLVNTGYMTTLQAFPEPLRSQMLYGDFTAGMEDDPWQVIPTAWVQASFDRWQQKAIKPEMLSMGVDVARGGKDNSVIFTRHTGLWFDKPHVFPGTETPDGYHVAGLVTTVRRDEAPIHIDVIGVGSSPFDILKVNNQTVGVDVSKATEETTLEGTMTFKNVRSMLLWRLREVLDPKVNNGIALPPDPKLMADLTAFRWRYNGMIIVESREDILKRIGRSPDYASALALALIDTPKRRVINQLIGESNNVFDYDPLSLA